MTVCLLQTYKSLQTEFVAVSHLAVGQFLKPGLTLKQTKVSEILSGKSKTSDVVGGTQRYCARCAFCVARSALSTAGCQYGQWLEGRKIDRQVGR